MVDVAKEAGVALRTVSRVINGDSTVGEALAERIRQAIVTLEYQPDERARQLRSGRTRTATPQRCHGHRRGGRPQHLRRPPGPRGS